ncbi:diphthine--ammonia ligase [Candidatus Woesearchaeota archaeon]|nr:diphthine--ammonia ligase [Candidatus Woesearchaeota archaeon]
MKEKLGAMVSGGKDSLYAMQLMQEKGHEITCAMNMKSANESSYMFHTPNFHLVELQAESMNVPLLKHETQGKKEEELKDLKEMLEKAKKEYGIEGITTGALFSDYQRERIENICEELNLKCFSPLWHMDQEQEMRDLMKAEFKIMFSSVAAHGFDESWLGRILDETDIDKLVEMNSKVGINIAGEGGEFESLVVDCPMFSKKLQIVDKEIIVESEHVAKMLVKEAKLVNKE